MATKQLPMESVLAMSRRHNQWQHDFESNKYGAQVMMQPDFTCRISYADPRSMMFQSQKLRDMRRSNNAAE